MQNKLLVAFLFLVIMSSFYWMSQAQQLEERFSVLRESFSKNDDAGGMMVRFQESEASRCPPVDVTSPSSTPNYNR